MPKALRNRPLCNKKCQKVRDNYLKAQTLPQSCLRLLLRTPDSDKTVQTGLDIFSRNSSRQTVVHINYTKKSEVQCTKETKNKITYGLIIVQRQRTY